MAKQKLKYKRPRGWLPSPAEIEAACLEIQREWSEEERAKRAGAMGRIAWTLPTVGASVAPERRQTQRARRPATTGRRRKRSKERR